MVELKFVNANLLALLIYSQSYRGGIEIEDDPAGWVLVDAPNRTVVELKYTIKLQATFFQNSPNRTVVELKLWYRN